MNKILIINLTRIGDLLQTTPLIRGLKRNHPQAELTLLVLDDFRSIATGFPDVDRLLSLDVNYFIPRLMNPKYSLEEHFSHLQKVLRRIEGDYDLVINLSHTRVSAALNRLLNCPDTRGMTLSKEGAMIVKHPWMNYFFYVTRHRLYNTFNLVDMYNMTGDIILEQRKLYYQEPPEVSAFPQEFLKGYSGKFIGFQMGTSTGDRRWEPESFAHLAQLIRDRLGWNIIVFGSQNEAKLVERMREAYQGPLIDATGKTTLPQLASLIRQCELLVTNDTGTMHLAVAVGTGVVALFLGEARADDTGPFTEKALILEANIDCAPCSYNTNCLDHVCHSFITPEDVLWAIENFYNLTQNEISQIEDDDRWEKLRVFRPKFEADGFLTLIPLTRRPLTFETLLKLLYRRNWKRFLNPECNTESEDLYSYYDFIADPNFVGRTEILLHKLQELALLGKKGVEIAKELSKIFHSPDVERLKKLTREMILLDNSIYHIEMTHPETAPITVYFRIQKNNAESDNLDYIANMAQNLYGRLQKQSEIMIEELMAFQKLSPMMKEAVAL